MRTAWGLHSLQTDCRDLGRLFDFLLRMRPQARFLLIGSSTGCQDIVAFMHTNRHAALVVATVLQAPVSDREFLVTQPGTAESLRTAERLVSEGKAEELMPRNTLDVPIPASRSVAIAAKRGEDGTEFAPHQSIISLCISISLESTIHACCPVRPLTDFSSRQICFHRTSPRRNSLLCSRM